MRTLLLLSAAVLTVSLGTAFAQNQTGSSQIPASPNASSQTVETVNSLPRNAETLTSERPGSDLATTQTAPGAAMTPIR